MPRKENYIVIPFEEWNVTNHTIGDTRQSKYGTFNRSPIHYNGLRFFIKTPTMFCRFGAEQPQFLEYHDEEKDTPRFIECFDGKRDTPRSQQWSIKLESVDDELFFKKSQEFDQFMIDQGVKKSHELLGSPRTNPFSREMVEKKYSRMFQCIDGMTMDHHYHHRRLKLIFPQVNIIPSGKTEFISEFYDENNQLIDHVTPETIKKIVPAKCTCLASIYGVVISRSMYYSMTWYIHQIKIFPPALEWPEKGICLLGENKKNDIESPTKSMIVDDNEEDDIEEEKEFMKDKVTHS